MEQKASGQKRRRYDASFKEEVLKMVLNGRADNPYDNAFMESCFSRLKAELLQGGAFQNKEDALTEIFEFIEMFYHTKKRHFCAQLSKSYELRKHLLFL